MESRHPNLDDPVPQEQGNFGHRRERLSGGALRLLDHAEEDVFEALAFGFVADVIGRKWGSR